MEKDFADLSIKFTNRLFDAALRIEESIKVAEEDDILESLI